ncbi:uncharacterized protein TM35_000142880 [Trypanosoma theileri]|uniref:Uncharacterized protein n=1 Tax=Trypanosoma theileri TaxID=67003 RepID=A0A1X0NWJ6_9TRYP|nr:uncharacterized protein TM35_000142880 [Trypanosoma theileri]ORC89077.1 hypothetical protein TM35_000142880 [Trypanosoma theileri]
MGGATLVCTLEVQGGGERTRRTLNVDRAPRTLRELAELLKAQDLRLQYGAFDLCVDRSEAEQQSSQSQSKSESQTQRILCDRDVVELFAKPPPLGRLKFVVTLPERSSKIASSMLADDELVHLCIYHPNNLNSNNQKSTETGKGGVVGVTSSNSGSGGKATRSVTEKRFITPKRGVREALMFAVRGAIPQPPPLSMQLELYALGTDEHDLRPLNDENAVNLLLRSCLAEHTACRLTYRFPTDIAAECVAPAAASKPVNVDRVAAATSSSDPTTKENAESDRGNSTKEEDATTVVDVFNFSKQDFATSTDVSDPIKDEHTISDRMDSVTKENSTAPTEVPSNPIKDEHTISDRMDSITKENSTAPTEVPSNLIKDERTISDRINSVTKENSTAPTEVPSNPIKDEHTISDRMDSITKENSTAPTEVPSNLIKDEHTISDRINSITKENSTAPTEEPSNPGNTENTEVVNGSEDSEEVQSPHGTSISVVQEVTLVSEPPELVGRSVVISTESFLKERCGADVLPLRASDEESPQLEEKPHLTSEEVKEPEKMLKEDDMGATGTNLIPISKIEIECSFHQTNVVVFQFSWEPNEPNLLETLQTACACAHGITSLDDVHLYNHEGAPLLSDEQTCAILDSVVQSGRTRIRLLLGIGNPCTTGLPLHCYITWGKKEVVLTCAVRPDNALNDLQNAILEEFDLTHMSVGDLKLSLRDTTSETNEELTAYNAYVKLKGSGADGTVLHVVVSNSYPHSRRGSAVPTVTTAAMSFAAEVGVVVGDRALARDVLPFFEDCLDFQRDVAPCGDGARDFVRVMVLLLAPLGGRLLPPAELVALVRDTAALAAAEEKEKQEDAKVDGKEEKKEEEEEQQQQQTEKTEEEKKEEEKKKKEKEEEKEEKDGEAAAVEAVLRAAVVARLLAARRPLDVLARFFRRVFRSLLPADGGRAVPLAVVTRQLALAGLPDARGLLRRDPTILAELQEKDYTELLLRLYNSNADVICRAVVASRLSGTSTITSRRVMTTREEELMRNGFLYELRHVFDGIRTSDVAKFLQTHELITEPRFQSLLGVVGDLLATHPVQHPYHWLVDRFKGKMADALDVKLRTFEDSEVSTPQLYRLCWNILKPELHHLSLLSESHVGSAFACWAFFAVQLVCINRKLEFPPVPLVDLQTFSLVEESTTTTTAVNGEEGEPTELTKEQSINEMTEAEPTPSTPVVVQKPAAPAEPVPCPAKKVKIKYKYSYLCRDLRQDARLARPVK